MKRLAALLILLVCSPAYAVDFTPIGGSGGAPTDATYITQTANGTLTAEQALGALASGILKNTTTTGVLSIASAGTDYVAPTGIDTSAEIAALVGDETGSGALMFGTSPTITTQATITGGTVTSSTPIIDATQTWNSGGVAFTALKINVTDTASASSSRLFDVQVGGASRFYVDKGGSVFAVPVSGDVFYTTTGARACLGSASVNASMCSLWSVAAATGKFSSTNRAFEFALGGDCILAGDAANTLAMRNSTNAQAFRVYNTDNGANDEYLQQAWSSNVLYVGPTYTGSATQRTMALNAGAEKTLTESSATSFVQIAVASGAHVGGVIHYTIIANDGTDYQTRAGTVAFSAVNKAGTETGAVGTAAETVAVSTGTLTNTFTVDTSPTNAINIQANAVSSLTQTTLAIRYWVEITGPSVTITPQ